MDPKNPEAGVCPLDKTKPAPKIMKKSKILTLPDCTKWQSYPRKSVVPWTLNPADSSKSTPYNRPWGELSTKSKKQRVVKFFKKYNDLLLDYFICYEFSEKGRFHCHGLLYFDNKNIYDYYHFQEQIRKIFGARKKQKHCFKGTPFNSLTLEAFNKSFNYVTKDINVIFKSRFKIKYTTKSGLVKVIIKNNQVVLNSQLLDPPLI